MFRKNDVRRIIVALFTVYSLFLLSACSSGEKLTQENVKDYLDISVTFHKHVLEELYNGDCFYDGATGTVTVSGTTTNYDYKNVELVVTISGNEVFDKDINLANFGSQKTYIPFSVDVPIKLNISGNGSADYTIPFVDGRTYYNGEEEKSKVVYFDYPCGAEAGYEVTSIKGTVSIPK